MSAHKVSRYRKVHVCLWNDGKFRQLSPIAPSAQALWLYLLTGPEGSIIPGLIAAGPAALSERLRWPVDAFLHYFAEIEQRGMALSDFDAKVIFLPNSLRYNPPSSPNVVRSWRNPWAEVPDCALKLVAYEAYVTQLPHYGAAFLKAFMDACAKPDASAAPPPPLALPPAKSVGAGATASAKADKKGHRGHAWCGHRWCVPSVLSEEFLRRLGPTYPTINLVRWYERQDKSAMDLPPTSEDAFTFWRQRFAADPPPGVRPPARGNPGRPVTVRQQQRERDLAHVTAKPLTIISDDDEVF